MKIQPALRPAPPSNHLPSHQDPVADIWVKLSDQPLLRIGWIALVGNQLFDCLGNVALNRIWVCHAPVSATPEQNHQFGQILAAIQHSAVAQAEQTVTFDALLPGYQASVRKYLHSRWQCLLVEDWAGQYIYFWANDTASLPRTNLPISQFSGRS